MLAIPQKNDQSVRGMPARTIKILFDLEWYSSCVSGFRLLTAYRLLMEKTPEIRCKTPGINIKFCCGFEKVPIFGTILIPIHDPKPTIAIISE